MGFELPNLLFVYATESRKWLALFYEDEESDVTVSVVTYD